MFAEMPKVALPRIGGPVEVVAQIARGHDPKGADRRERARLRTPEGVLAIARVVDDLTLAPPGQIEIPHEDITGIALARIAIPVRPALVIVITPVGLCFLVA